MMNLRIRGTVRDSLIGIIYADRRIGQEVIQATMLKV